MQTASPIQGVGILITALPAAGKTTLGNALAQAVESVTALLLQRGLLHEARHA